MFMLFKSFSMARVWSMYNMMQVLTSTTFMQLIIMPNPADNIHTIIRGVCFFNILSEPTVRIWLEQYVFKHLSVLQEVIIEMEIGFILTAGGVVVLVAVLIVGYCVKSNKV